jgi:hypothetical protein
MIQLHADIERLFQDRDTNGLVLALMPSVEAWARGRILARGAELRRDLIDELVQLASAELLQAVPRMFDRPMEGAEHIIRSAHKTVVAKFIEFLHELPLLHVKQKTLKKRRRHLREGTLEIPDSARRLPDMPESVSGEATVFKPWEFRRQVSSSPSTDASGRFEFESPDDYFYPGEIRRNSSAGYVEPQHGCEDVTCTEHWDFVNEVREKSLELSTGTTRRAVELLLSGTWIEPRNCWECPDISTVAQKLGVNRRTLLDRLRAFAVTIATTATTDIADIGERLLGSRWEKSAENSENSSAKFAKVAIGTNREQHFLHRRRPSVTATRSLKPAA